MFELHLGFKLLSFVVLEFFCLLTDLFKNINIIII